MVNKRILLNCFMIIVLLLQGAINLGGYYQIQQLLDANKTVLHTHKVTYLASELWNRILEMQNDLRGYIITANRNNLVSFERNIQTARNQIKRLKLLVHDNPHQIKRLDQLSGLLDERVIFYRQVLAAYTLKGEEAAEQLIASDKGASLSTEIRRLAINIQNEEFILLDLRNQALTDNSAFTKKFLLFTLISTSLVIGLFLVIFNLQYSKAVLINRRRKQAENQLKGIIGATTDGIAAIDDQFNLIIFNEAFRECFSNLFGKAVDYGLNLKNALTDSPEEQIFLKNLGDALASPRAEIIRKIGASGLTPTIYEITYSTTRDSSGTATGVALVSRDVTARFEMEKAMKKTNLQLTHSMAEIKQHNRAISYLNLLSSTLHSCLSIEETFSPIRIYAEKILPSTAGRLYLSHPSRNYLDLAIEWGELCVHEEDVISPEACWALRRGQLHRFHSRTDSVICEHLRTSRVIPSYLCVPLQAQNDNVGLLYLELKHSEGMNEDNFNHLVEEHESLIINFSEAIASSLANIKLRDTLRLRSIRDPLTGLYNRSYLEESFAREIERAKRHANQLAVIMMDLDHFKKINDSYGHDAGDMVLVEVTRYLLQQIRQTDIACRYGGEEFLLLLVDIASQQEVLDRVERFRQLISDMLFNVNGKTLKVTASFGVAFMFDHGESQAQLIEAADKALYRSKKNGRNQITVAKGTGMHEQPQQVKRAQK
ncbi:diguanylate cyclase [Legionella rubrilucens]|nr:diguanylate cyclase [Legionella rubrilucens]